MVSKASTADDFIPIDAILGAASEFSSRRPSPPSLWHRSHRPVLLVPEPPPAPAHPGVVMAAGKKQRVVVSEETRGVAVARVDALIKAGNPSGEAIASVAKELGVSESAVVNWRTIERKKTGVAKAGKLGKPGKPAKKARATPRVEEAIASHIRQSQSEPAPLDLALDLLALASKARERLGEASRKRLLAELNVRLG